MDRGKEGKGEGEGGGKEEGGGGRKGGRGAGCGIGQERRRGGRARGGEEVGGEHSPLCSLGFCFMYFGELGLELSCLFDEWTLLSL